MGMVAVAVILAIPGLSAALSLGAAVTVASVTVKASAPALWISMDIQSSSKFTAGSEQYTSMSAKINHEQS
jgi:hypothetical protein